MRSYRIFYVALMLLSMVMLASCDNAEEKYQKYLKRGDTFYDNHDYIKARLEYKNAAKIMPANARVIYSLGLVEEAEGTLQSALSAFLVAEQQDPAYEPVLLKLAEFYLTAQQFEEARIRVNKILEMNPQHATAHALKGSLFLREKAFARAEQEVEIALQNDSDNVIAYSVLTGIHIAKKELGSALDVLEKAISLNKKELSFYLLKAAIYSEQDNIDAIAQVYKEIFELYPEKIRFRFDLAKILSDVGKMVEAGAVYRDTVRDFPENPEAKHRLISFLEGQENMEIAEKELQSFIQSSPEQKIFHLWLADLYIRNHQDERAVATLENIINTEPNDWIGLNASTALAEIQLSKGDIELAENLISSVLKKDVNNREALLLQANLAFSQGDYQKSIVDLRTILQDDPGSLKASRILAEAFLIQGRIDLAVDTLLQAAEKHPEEKGTRVRLAQFYALRGNYEKAKEILLGIINIDPAYSVGWETLARLSIENKQWEKAEEAVAKLEKQEGQKEVAAFLDARIKEKTGMTPQAVILYKEIIKASPSAPIAAYALSSLLEMSHAPEHLKDMKSFLLSLHSDSSTILTVLGGVEAALGHEEEAEAAFRSAIRENARDQTPYILLAEILIQQEEMEQALEMLKKAEDALPTEIKASMMRADLLIQSGRIDEAISVYENILQRNDRADAVANNLSQTLADFKYQDKEAMERAQHIAERFINADNPYFLDTLGWVYFKQKRIEQAEPILARAVILLKQPNPQIDYHYGALLLESGQKDKAKEYLQRAVSGTKYQGFEEAQKLLHTIN
ncbi:MAG: hypothetical protein CO093_06905 [Alphaproteobacteria bacterium CG_4_9_14_3_um_filter_47_13]|nr:MAG: hypothetical protein CO093_06905 [Alphaproteobacteria bacterium CG_4_9_14_3_um_filter_47_13]